MDIEKKIEKQLKDINEKGLMSEELDKLLTQKKAYTQKIEKIKSSDLSDKEKKSKTTSIEATLKGMNAKIHSVSRELLLNARTDEEKAKAKEKMAMMRSQRGKKSPKNADEKQKTEAKEKDKPKEEGKEGKEGNESFWKKWGVFF